MGDKRCSDDVSSVSNGQATLTTAHDWEKEKHIDKDFYDDGTMSFFWRAHRMTTLMCFFFVLAYFALWDDSNYDANFNTKRGIVAVICAFVVLGVTTTPDGPFKRPHPALWRLVLVLGIVYELFLVFLLFQSVDNARQLMKHLDPKLGVPLPEKDYGGNCRLYDEENPEDPFHHFWDKMDGFVVAHFIGWWVKTLVLRDWWLCMVTSILFEIIEYTFEHQLPNFSECWWDHWLMDVVLCNGFGIFLGMKTLKYLSMKPYHWRGVWNIPTYRGKLWRILKQFTPCIWMEFNWRPTSSLKRWLAILGIVGLILVSELNTFTLKFVLWIPPDHILCLGRLVLLTMWGAVALREGFQLLDDPECRKLGAQSLLLIAIIVTEVLIAFKFDWDTFTKPFPRHVTIMLLLGVLSLALWTLWHFYIQGLLRHTEQKMNGNGHRHVDKAYTKAYTNGVIKSRQTDRAGKSESSVRLRTIKDTNPDNSNIA